MASTVSKRCGSALSEAGSSSRGKKRRLRSSPGPPRKSCHACASSIITATPPFMSLAPSPTTAPSSIRPGLLACAGTVSRCPARTTSGGLSGWRSPYQSVSPSRQVGLPIAPSTYAAISASFRLSEGIFTSSSVRVARRSARAVIVSKRGTIPGVTTRQEASSGVEPERGLVLAVLPKSIDAEQELGELRELARTAGVEPIGELVQQRARPDPRTYVGKGKLDELKQAYEHANAEVLLVDDELEPSQQRALENALTARVVDRTQLILDIFAQHATSAEGKLQVELAQLEYNLPRMRGMWQHLERLGGGRGTLGAGVGTRGPGESQLETDRRLARRRISLLKRRLA